MRTSAEQKNLKHLELIAMGELCQEPLLAMEISRRGLGVNEFIREVAARTRNESASGVSERMLGLGSGEIKGYSISNIILAAADRNLPKAGLEKAISDLGLAKTGCAPLGDFSVPMGMLTRDFNAATASQAGNLIGANIDGTRSVDPLRKISAIARMGASFVTGLNYTLQLPRFDSTSTVAAKSEVASSDTILETSSLAILTPKRYAVRMILSRQALLQSTPELDASIGRHLMKAIMAQLEYDALNGDGTSDTPVGLRNTSGVGDVAGGTNGAQISWAHLSSLENKTDAANAEETDFSGFIVNSSTRKWLRNTVRASGLPFIWDDGSDRPLLGHRTACSNVLPSNLTKAASGAVCSAVCYSSDWSQLVIGIHGAGVDVLVDRFTLAGSGQLIINASILAGVGLNQPAAFSKMDDGLTA